VPFRDGTRRRNGASLAVAAGWESDGDQWTAAHLGFARTWLAGLEGRRWPVAEASVRVTRNGKTQQAQHGSFDNNVEVIRQTIERISGAKIVAPIGWLDC